ncbi:SAC3/GANP/Nin1/mts3/eIF-3 p25 family-domain-containing protein [Crepidotus variabilis]|uniref:SAC3/GANP/Nin1/mts3/eIF-3 p25 family-domain-containing protein n=1 Tax=Crepidotus variabilis TaxID=179855 RepID=A0A9P6E551_9AGAR|nr:SAC3/GANP/Nin1/mts3/eIF-3 p25 family-domain-containing protein [Crepidotus variabilis]
MSSESWPPQLKEWVAKCLGQITDANRVDVQSELKQVIGEAFSAHTLWTTDWAGVQLKSLLPKPAITFNNLKRKSFDAPNNTNKKAKKLAGKNSPYTSTTDYGDQLALNKRAERFQREHELEKTKHLRIGHQNANRSLNNSGTTRSSSVYSGNDEPEGDPNVIGWDRYTIVGTSQELFKDYLRLTSEPKPETIRPYAVLQRTLTELKMRWKKKEEFATSYNWICNQLKSLRQDLTVQRIKNEFTVQVYEIHARIALESNDMVEYNQCQATLKTLYDLGIPGKVEEFTAYRILMFLHGRNRSELNLYVGQLTHHQKADPAVVHALEVQRALAMGNYHKLCQLYMTAPFMGPYIMDHFIDRERVKGLMVMAKAYRTAPLPFLQRTFGFDTLEDARTFLIDHKVGAFFTNPNSPDSEKILDCKAMSSELTKAFEERYRKIAIRGAI